MMPVQYHRPMARDEKMTVATLVRMPPSMAALVDAWRRDQVDLPTRAEAIRRLAAMSLKAESSGGMKPKGAKRRD